MGVALSSSGTRVVLLAESEERSDRQLLVKGGMTQQSLLLQLLKLLGAGEVERMRPQVGAGVDEGGTQRFVFIQASRVGKISPSQIRTSSERVHDGLLCYCAGVHHLLGLADLSVGLGKLQSDGLWEVWVEPHSLLEILLGSLSTGPATEGDEPHWRGCLAVLAGHLQQRPLVTLVGSE